MWHLEEFVIDKTRNIDQRQQYLDLLLKPLKDKLEKSSFSKAKGCPLFDDKTLENLLTFQPKELKELQDILMNSLVEDYNEAELPQYAKAESKKVDKRIGGDRELIKKYHCIQLLKNVFDYQALITASNKKDVAYTITRMKGTHICTYCGREYVFTVDNKRDSKSSKIVRPELDHWFPKSLYPLMALSYYNLIPSCHLCNSNLKGKTEFNFADYIHPYLTPSNNPPFSFYPIPAEDEEWKVATMVDKTSPTHTRHRTNNMLNVFRLQEMYSCHGPHEVKDLIELAQANNDTYIEDLLAKVMSDLGLTKQDAYRILLGTDYDDLRGDTRPLSKLKRDVIRNTVSWNLDKI